MPSKTLSDIVNQTSDKNNLQNLSQEYLTLSACRDDVSKIDNTGI